MTPAPGSNRSGGYGGRAIPGLGVETMLARLRPLMPDRVQRWSRSRERVGPELRVMLDRQITAIYRQTTARNVLPLLSLPHSKVSGPIKLGRVEYAGQRQAFGLRESDLLRHTAVFGQSGSGKTNTVLQMIEQVSRRGVPVLFFDWKRTGRRFIQHEHRAGHKIYTAGRDVLPLPFNPFLPPPEVEPYVHAQQTVDLLAEAYTLGDGARSLLQRAITDQLESYPNRCTAEDLVRRVQDMADNSRSRQWAVTAERVLNELRFIRTAQSTAEEQKAFINHLSRHANSGGGATSGTSRGTSWGITFVELDALSLPGRAFMANALTAWLYRARLTGKQRDKLDLLVVFEEAHHLLHQKESTRTSQLETLLRLVRETGIGVVLVDQTPSRMSSIALANTFTTICLNIKHPSDVQRAASVLGLPPEDRGVLLKLPVGYSVVRLAERWDQPFLVQVPGVELADSSLSDDQMLRLLRQTQESSRPRSGPPAFAHLREALPRISQGPQADSVLSDRSVVLLQDILKHPDDGVKRRYFRLGLTVGAGHRLKCALIKSGHLEQAMVPFEHTHKAVLGLTSKARDELGIDATEVSGASLPHRYWQRWWARRLESMGYSTSIEAPRSSDEADGKFDVLAKRDGTSIAVEIETGKSDVEANIRRGLKVGIDRVLVVATDEQAMSKLESRLAKSGLLIRGRVDLVLRDRVPDWV